MVAALPLLEVRVFCRVSRLLLFFRMNMRKKRKKKKKTKKKERMKSQSV